MALAFTGILAAATGAYPMVIQLSFDTLMKGDVSWLPRVLAAIIFITAVRSVFLYLQTVATQRIVLRLTADMRRVSPSATSSPRTTLASPGYARPVDVQAHERRKLHPAGGSRLPQHRGARPPDRDRARRLDVLSRLVDLAHRARRLPIRCGTDRKHLAPCQAHVDADAARARRHDLASGGAPRSDTPYQDVPA